MFAQFVHQKKGSHPVRVKKPRAYVDKINPRCQFHQLFYEQLCCTKVLCAAFSHYGLAWKLFWAKGNQRNVGEIDTW